MRGAGVFPPSGKFQCEREEQSPMARDNGERFKQRGSKAVLDKAGKWFEEHFEQLQEVGKDGKKHPSRRHLRAFVRSDELVRQYF